MPHALIVSILLAVAPAAAQPSDAATPAQGASPAAAATLLGVALGDPSKAVRALLGKPREILSASLGDVWRYDEDRGNATLDVVIAGDAVVDVAARTNDGKVSSLADPWAGALGMTVAALTAARGAPVATIDGGAHLVYDASSGGRWFYAVDNGVVTGIELTSPAPPAPAAQVIADARHDGSAIDRALVVNAATESDGVQAEMTYLGTLACDGDGRFSVVGQELVAAGGRYFDLLHTICSTSKHPRDFYFDATSFYGK